jgi:hypothetical protein
LSFQHHEQAGEAFFCILSSVRVKEFEGVGFVVMVVVLMFVVLGGFW